MRVTHQVQSVCECQARLVAELDEKRNVTSGWAILRGARESAPANAVSDDGERFDVVWKCPMCGRNTLRSFHVGAMRRGTG